MKQRILIALACAGAFFAASAEAAQTYTFDPNHAQVAWRINHFGFSNPSGKIQGVTGSVTLDEQHPEKSSVTATIPVANLLTGVAKLDEHLKSKDFFDVAQYPTATFVSSKVEQNGRDMATVSGNLTLHGVTKPVDLQVHLNQIGINMMKKKTAGFSITTELKRSDFGIDHYLPGLSDEVKVGIEVEANIEK